MQRMLREDSVWWSRDLWDSISVAERPWGRASPKTGLQERVVGDTLESLAGGIHKRAYERQRRNKKKVHARTHTHTLTHTHIKTH